MGSCCVAPVLEWTLKSQVPKPKGFLHLDVYFDLLHKISNYFPIFGYVFWDLLAMFHTQGWKEGMGCAAPAIADSLSPSSETEMKFTREIHKLTI